MIVLLSFYEVFTGSGVCYILVMYKILGRVIVTVSTTGAENEHGEHRCLEHSDAANQDSEFGGSACSEQSARSEHSIRVEVEGDHVVREFQDW